MEKGYAILKFPIHKGVLLALATVIVWAILNVVNRYCILRYDTNVITFTSFMIFSSGVSLLLIRQQVTPEDWKKGVKYSWLYTAMQIIRSFFIISTFIYITSTETSLLFNIEIVLTYIMTYLFFRRIPHKGDYLGIFTILIGFILFILTFPQGIRLIVTVLILASAIASCIRSIVVEETTIINPHNTVRQKCGISGYTLFVGGLALIIIILSMALLKYWLGEGLPGILFFLEYLPGLRDVLHPATIISACIAGFFINAATTYLYYATLKFSTSENFMAVRAFQPALTYLLELIASIFYVAMRPELDTKDYILGGVIILGSLLILIIPSGEKDPDKSKDFIAD